MVLKDMEPAKVVGYHLPFTASLTREHLLAVFVKRRVRGSPSVNEPMERSAPSFCCTSSRHYRADELMRAVAVVACR